MNSYQLGKLVKRAQTLELKAATLRDDLASAGADSEVLVAAMNSRAATWFLHRALIEFKKLRSREDWSS